MYALDKEKFIKTIKLKTHWSTKDLLRVAEKLSTEIPDEEIQTLRESFWCESCKFECEDICKISEIMEKLI